MFLNNALAQKLFMIYVTQGIADGDTAMDIVTSMSDEELLKNIKLYEKPKIVKKGFTGRNIVKNIGKRGLKMSPAGLLADIGSRIGMKNEAVQDLINPKPLTYKHGGLVGINSLTRPLGI